jgi:methionine-rich copper-binding protein CopC
MTLSELRNGATRVTPLLVLLAALLLLAPQAAFAHAKLLRSEPKAKSSLPRPPQAVELWFSEELEAGFNTIEVKDERSSRFDRGEVTLGEGGKMARVDGGRLTGGLVLTTPGRPHIKACLRRLGAGLLQERAASCEGCRPSGV